MALAAQRPTSPETTNACTHWYDTEYDALDAWFEHANTKLLVMKRDYDQLHDKACAVRSRLLVILSESKQQ